jgi:hypothetical protein
VLVFFDAIARGNADSLKGMLAMTDQVELDALVDSGSWKDATSRIRRIDVQTGRNDEDWCALAVIEVGSGFEINFQPQLWYYRLEQETPTFEAAACPPGMMDRLSGSDWIVAWHKILDDEAKLAAEPDAEMAIVQRDISSNQGGGGMAGGGGAPSGPGGLRGPGGPGGPPPDPGGPAGR